MGGKTTYGKFSSLLSATTKPAEPEKVTVGKLNGEKVKINNLITYAKAKSIALNNAKVKAANIFNYEIKLDKEKGIYVYEVEFDTKNYEYEYEINAKTGKIIEKDVERR